MALFEVENLQKSYYTGEVETPVLHGLSFEIERGEFVSVMGPSGSGKSTLLHILGLLDYHTGGEYRFNGTRFSDFTDNELAYMRNREMGFVFQAFNLLPRQSIYENVKLPLFYSSRSEHEWDERIREVVDIVGLTHRIDYETYKLSGGEKQRTAIARALVNEPNVIFADEPTGNLDTKSGQSVLETLEELHEEHRHTVVLITHESYTAAHAERMIELRDGEIIGDAPIAERRRVRGQFRK